MSSTRKKLANKTSKLSSKKDDQAESSGFEELSNGSFYYVEVNLINPNPYQPRQYFDPEALSELAQSIKEKGLIQPIVVRQGEDEKIYLVAGDRRLKASKEAGLEKVPAVFTTGNPAEISLIENLQRENLKPVEEAEALARMMQEHSYTQAQLASVIGKARTTITETLSLNKLPGEVKEECRHTDIPRRILTEISKQKDPEKAKSLLKNIKEGSLESGQVRNQTRKKTKRAKRDPTVIALEKVFSAAEYLSNLNLEKSKELFQMKDPEFTSVLLSIKEIIDNYLNEDQNKEETNSTSSISNSDISNS